MRAFGTENILDELAEACRLINLAPVANGRRPSTTDFSPAIRRHIASDIDEKGGKTTRETTAIPNET
jgi:hypothetical protein